MKDASQIRLKGKGLPMRDGLHIAVLVGKEEIHIMTSENVNLHYLNNMHVNAYVMEHRDHAGVCGGAKISTVANASNIWFRSLTKRAKLYLGKDSIVFLDYHDAQTRFIPYLVAESRLLGLHLYIKRFGETIGVVNVGNATFVSEKLLSHWIGLRDRELQEREAHLKEKVPKKGPTKTFPCVLYTHTDSKGDAMLLSDPSHELDLKVVGRLQSMGFTKSYGKWITYDSKATVKFNAKKHGLVIEWRRWDKRPKKTSKALPYMLYTATDSNGNDFILSDPIQYLNPRVVDRLESIGFSKCPDRLITYQSKKEVEEKAAKAGISLTWRIWNTIQWDSQAQAKMEGEDPKPTMASHAKIKGTYRAYVQSVLDGMKPEQGKTYLYDLIQKRMCRDGVYVCVELCVELEMYLEIFGKRCA